MTGDTPGYGVQEDTECRREPRGVAGAPSERRGWAMGWAGRDCRRASPRLGKQAQEGGDGDGGGAGRGGGGDEPDGP